MYKTYVAVDKNGNEWVFNNRPYKLSDSWYIDQGDCVQLPNGSIKKLTGIDLTWESEEPLELKL